MDRPPGAYRARIEVYILDDEGGVSGRASVRIENEDGEWEADRERVSEYVRLAIKALDKFGWSRPGTDTEDDD